MSMPTSMVVVHDSTSMAARSLLPGPRQCQVDVLEEQFVLLGLREDSIGLSGVELSGVLGSDDAQDRLARADFSARSELAR